MTEHRRSEGYNILRDGDFCAECGEIWPCPTALLADRDRIVADAHQMTQDLQRIAHELGIPARPYSGHEAMEKDILPAIKAGVAARALLRDAAERLMWADAAIQRAEEVPDTPERVVDLLEGARAEIIALRARIEGGAS